MIDSSSIGPVDLAIWKKFHVHKGDVPPYTGWVGTRGDLADLFGELEFNVGAEIGVQSGRYSKRLCKGNPNLTLHAIDSWAPFSHHDQEWQDGRYEQAVLRTKSFPKCRLIKKFSIEASRDYADGFFDFVYIDAMHDFDNVMLDILHWAPKVKQGGILCGHDYEHYYDCGVVRAVDAYCGAHGINLYYITPKDPPRSWFFVIP